MQCIVGYCYLRLVVWCRVTDLQMCLEVSCNLLHSRWLCCSRSRPPGTCGWGTGGCPAPWAPARRSFSRGLLAIFSTGSAVAAPPCLPILFPVSSVNTGLSRGPRYLLEQTSLTAHTHTHQLQKHHLHSIHIRTTITLIYRLHNTHIWTLISPWQLWQMIQTPPAAVNIKLMSCDQNRVQKNSSI